MTSTWPETVERVAVFLRDARAEARLEEHAGNAATAQEAAETIGCELRQIVKSLVFVCDGSTVVVLVPGDRRADAEKIARAAGASSARVARADEVVAATGFPPGSVAPFAGGGARVLVEQILLTEPLVWAGGGSPRHMVALSPVELVRLARGVPMDVVEEPAYDSASTPAED
jgi:prolyl-tRNA editing enzyme YbaK/EbsC (Cys-tRNA(Pro) deacylase)